MKDACLTDCCALPNILSRIVTLTNCVLGTLWLSLATLACTHHRYLGPARLRWNSRQSAATSAPHTEIKHVLGFQSSRHSAARIRRTQRRRMRTWIPKNTS
eukprot:3239843-Amphidinium_carterae.1